MRWIIGASLKFRRLIIAMALGLVVFGLFQLDDAPVEVLPEFNPVVVEVQTEALGLSASEVEQLITVPLEQDLLNGVAFLDGIESASLPGLSSVMMTFESGTPLLDARQVVQERLTQAHALPNVSKPPEMLQPLSSTARVSMVRLSSEKLNPIEMSVLARWVIVPRLLGVDGVANVSIFGQRDRQLQVQVDPKQLAEKGVSLQQVIATAGNALEFSPLSYLEASNPGTGGFIENLNQRLGIFHEQAISTPQELADVPVENAEGQPTFVDGKPMLLGDVTKVVEDHQPLIGDARCAGTDCVMLVIEKFPGANTLEVTDDVEDAIEVMQPGLGDMVLDTSVYRPARFVERSMTNLAVALAIGAGLVLLALLYFLRNWRQALATVSAIAVAAVAALGVLRLQGAPFNLMVLSGLVLGLVVIIDDAVGDVANAARRLREHRGGELRVPLWRATRGAIIEMRSSALYGGLVIAAALLPVFLMKGSAGAFLPPMAGSYLLAIAVSMGAALLVTPALAMTLLSTGSVGEAEPALARRLREKVSTRSVSRSGRAFLALGAAFAIGIAVIPFLGISSKPTLNERELLVDVAAKPGTSLPKMTEMVDEAVGEVGALSGVDTVGAHVGRAITSDQRANVNTGEIWISLDPKADIADTRDAIRTVFDRQDGINATLHTYSEARVAETLGTKNNGEAVVRIYGEDREILNDKAEEIRNVLAGVDGVEKAEVQDHPEEPTIEVEVDLERAKASGIKPGDVRRSAAVLLSGITVGNLYEQQKVFDVVVWGAPEIRRTVDDVRNLTVSTPGGTTVRLGDVADVRIANNYTVVQHEATSTYLDVTAAVAGGEVDAAADGIQQALAQVDFPLEHHAKLLGTYAEPGAVRTRVFGGAMAAAAAIFLLLQAAFSSWRLASLVFLTMPMALAGGFVATLLTGGTITLGSTIGLVAVLGLAARNALVLIRRYQDLQWRAGKAFGPDLVVEGTRDRLGPILTTTAAVGLLQLPFVFSGGAAGLEIIRPMAVTVLGGLVTTALYSLVVVPALYLRFGRVRMPDTSAEELSVLTIPDLDEAARSPRGNR